jgi:hypothetical protein
MFVLFHQLQVVYAYAASPYAHARQAASSFPTFLLAASQEWLINGVMWSFVFVDTQRAMPPYAVEPAEERVILRSTTRAHCHAENTLAGATSEIGRPPPILQPPRSLRLWLTRGAVTRFSPARTTCLDEGRFEMFGRILWPAVVIAFLADLVVDWAFGNTVVNMVTFGVVFAVVVLVRYSQRTD